MSAFKNYFDGIDTAANTAAECGEIRSKAAKIKKRRKAATSAVGVTLAVMMTTTVAVSAAGGWDITEIIGRWFKGDTASITDNLSVVTAENAENKSEIFDVAPNGSVIDDNMIIFFLDVTRNDGNIFDCEEYAVTTKDGSIVYDSNGEKLMDIPQYYFDNSDVKFVINITEENGFNYDSERGVPYRQYLVDDGSPSDNKITIAFCCDRTSLESQLGEKCYMPTGTEAIDISDAKRCEFKSVKLNIGSLVSKKDFVLSQRDGCYFIDRCSTERIDGSWNGELMFDIKSAKSVTIEPNRASTFEVYPVNLNRNDVPEKYGYSFNVDKITLSQMSVSFDISAESPDRDSYIETLKIGEIIMKNGDTLTIQSDSLVPCLYHESGGINAILPTEYQSPNNKWEISASIMLTEPIDPDEVEAVRLGDTTFPIE